MPDDDTTDTPRMFTQDEVNKIAAKAREQGRAERKPGSPAPSAEATPPPDNIADIVARTVAETIKAMQQPQQAPTTPPAAAPAAPSPHTLPTLDGVVDYFSLGIDQINALGPHGLRDLHERALSVGNRGAPLRPQAPNSKRR